MMKRILVVILFSLALFVPSCKEKIPTGSTKIIQGSGHPATEMRSLGTFHSVDLTTVGNVNITFGSIQEVSITVDDNILEHITTIVTSGKLTIGMESGVHVSNFNLAVNLTMTDLEELALTGAGSIIGKNKFIVDSASLISDGEGEISLQLEADLLSSSLTGAGEIYISGKARQHRIEITGAGTMHAFELQTETTTMRLAGAGYAEVNVSQLLDVTISGSGLVYYKGHPEIIQNITGTGRIIDSN